MGVSNVTADDSHRLRIEGTLGIAGVSTLKAKILESLQVHPCLVLDLDTVDECDTAGVQLLVASTRLASKDGNVVRLGRCSEAVQTTAAKLGLRLTTADGDKEA